jgi:hypothetical protein
MTAETWVLIIWAIGLLGALPPTLIIVKEVRLVLGTLTAIRVLADRTAEAARGIAQHVEPVPEMAATLDHAEPLLHASRRMRAAASALADGVDATLGPSRVERLGRWLARWVTGRTS